MSNLWLHDAGSVCIHPSQRPLLGVNAVLSSWKRLFNGGDDNVEEGGSNNNGFQRNRISPTNIRSLENKLSLNIIECTFKSSQIMIPCFWHFPHCEVSNFFTRHFLIPTKSAPKY